MNREKQQRCIPSWYYFTGMIVLEHWGLPTTTGKRWSKSRHAFDIYEDQVDELQKLSLEDRLRGGAGSMSAMVRESIDDYIAKVQAK